MLVTKGIPGADGWTDHHFVISKMKIRLQPRGKRRDKRPPAHRLANLSVVAAAAIKENASVKNRWCQLRDMVQSEALDVRGRARRQHQDWFDNDAAITNLLSEKNRLHKAYVNCPTDDNETAFYLSRRFVQPRLREMQKAWMVHQPKKPILFLAPTKPPYSPRRSKFDSDGPNTSKAPSTVPQPSPTPLSPVCLKWRPTPTSTTCLLYTKPSKSSSSSPALPAEIYKYSDPELVDYLTALFQEMWRQGEVPQDFKDVTIVHLYKRKKNRQICNSHHGIFRSSVAGKIFASILLNHLNNHLEQGLLLKSQLGFPCYRGTIDMIFTTRQQQKYWEMRTHFFSTFVDLTKVFDAVDREELGKILQKFSCPERFTQMVCHFHDGTTARVTDNGVVSEVFAVTK
ncbi:hypothetical protein SprV_0301294900 [Sparganum proliferum]